MMYIKEYNQHKKLDYRTSNHLGVKRKDKAKAHRYIRRKKHTLNDEV